MMNMSAPPPSMPPPPPGGPPPSGQGHGPFSEEDINQIMIETGYSYDQVCKDIDASGATSKEQLYPQLYSGAGIEPQQPADGQMASDSVVQGQPPAEPGAPPAAIPPEAGAEVSQNEGGMSMGIDPKVAQALHSAMSPSSRYKRRT